MACESIIAIHVQRVSDISFSKQIVHTNTCIWRGNLNPLLGMPVIGVNISTQYYVIRIVRNSTTLETKGPFYMLAGCWKNDIFKEIFHNGIENIIFTFK